MTLDFHFNAALTSINVAKIALVIQTKRTETGVFDGNRLFLKSVFKALDINPNQQEKNQRIIFLRQKSRLIFHKPLDKREILNDIF